MSTPLNPTQQELLKVAKGMLGQIRLRLHLAEEHAWNINSRWETLTPQAILDNLAMLEAERIELLPFLRKASGILIQLIADQATLPFEPPQ